MYKTIEEFKKDFKVGDQITWGSAIQNYELVHVGKENVALYRDRGEGCGDDHVFRGILDEDWSKPKEKEHLPFTQEEVSELLFSGPLFWRIEGSDEVFALTNNCLNLEEAAAKFELTRDGKTWQPFGKLVENG